MSKLVIKVHMTRDVFVAGGTPSLTYNARQGRQIENKVAQYLAQSGKALTVHGPSKSGKTSLIERLLPANSAIWLQGQDIQQIDDFWSQLAKRLEIASQETISDNSEESIGTSYGVTAGVPKLVSGDWSRTDNEKTTLGRTRTSSVHIPEDVRISLSKTRTPIVMDDFHYIDDGIKAKVSRAIKTVVRCSPIILIAVPSEAFELVRVESEMLGRVWSVSVPSWTDDELAVIAAEGFPLLNLLDAGGGVARTLARVSYGSPFIMQQLCHDLVRFELDVVETRRDPLAIVLPADLERFLADSADRAVPPIFSRLLAGPATKGTERKEIQLVGSGVRTDIYGAVLTAIKNLLPGLEHQERTVHAEVQRITTTQISLQRVNNALRQMNEIAFTKRGVSDPVLRLRDDKLYLQDSILAFYLKHGTWSAEKV